MKDEYEIKEIQAGHMIMNKDTAVHTCNGCNKRIKKYFIQDGTLNQKMVLLQ